MVEVTARSVLPRLWLVAFCLSGALTTAIAQIDCIPPPSGLIAWWPGDRIAFDFVGGNHGTFQNGATYAAGAVGEAFSFSGANYVSVPDKPVLNPTNAITVECWLYRSSIVGAFDPVIKKAGEGTDQVDGYALEFGGDEIIFFIYNGSWIGVGGGPINLEEWYHLAGVYDGTNLFCYVNGSLAGPATPVSGSITPSSNPLGIGSDPANPDRFLNGKVDEVSIYNRALTGSEIQAIYTAGGGKCKPPYVTATIPQYGATQVAVGTDIRATFSEAMDGTALTTNTFLVMDASGNQVPGTVTYQATSTQAVFTASAPLATGRFYMATVKAGVRAISGLNTLADYPWVFWTTGVSASVFWVGADGDWNSPANWSTGTLPGPTDDVLIDRPDLDLTVTISTGTNTIRSLTCAERLRMTGGSLAISQTSVITRNFILLAGTLSGGTNTITSGARLIGGGGTLDGVTLDGELEVGVSGDGQSLVITNGLVLNGTAYVGNGTNFNFGALLFDGTQSVGGSGTILFGAHPGQPNGLVVRLEGTVLTLGTGITVRGAYGTLGRNASWPGAQNLGVINQGTIWADTPDGVITINVPTITTAALGKFRQTGGTIVVPGVIDNTGANFLLDNTTGSWMFNQGTIRGGTITASDGTRLIGSGGTLDGVTADTDLQVSGGGITVTNGLTFNGQGTFIGNAGGNVPAFLSFEGTQTLSGVGQLTFSDGGGGSSAGETGMRVSGGSLTIDSGITIRGGNAEIGSASQPLVNRGTIIGDTTGRALTLAGNSVRNEGILRADAGGTIRLTGTWSNIGSLLATNGATIELGGIFTPRDLGTIIAAAGFLNLSGLLNNVGSVLSLDGQTGPLRMLSSSRINGGVVNGPAGIGIMVVGAVGILDGVTVDSELQVTGGGITITNGLTLNGQGTFIGNAGGNVPAFLSFAGTQTLSGVGQLTFSDGDNGSSAGETGIRISNGSLTIDSGITIRGGIAQIGSAGQPLLNRGTIISDTPGRPLTLIGHSLINEGTLAARVGGANILVASDLVLSPSSVLSFVLEGRRLGLDYGQVSVAGNVAFDGTLRVALTNGFTPVVGDTFALLNDGSRSGGFRRTEGLALSGDPFLQLDLGEQTLSLVTKSLFGNPPPPATNLVNQVVALGGTASFHIEPLGQEPFSYLWSFNGTNILSATGPTLTITNVQLAHAGTYSLVVTDGGGGVTTYSATLSVLGPPAVTSQPVGQAVAPGTTVTLSAAATGDGPLQFQWQLNGANIEGATNSSFTIPNAQPASGGAYNVTMANAVGAVRSDIAFVVVTSPALPLSDNFAGRQSTNSFSGVGGGTNTNATSEAGEPNHAGKPGGKSVWYSWTAPANGVATFSTRGSSFDTVLAVYLGNALTSLSPVASDDDGGGFFTSETVFQAIAGTNYIIAIDGLGGASGDVVLGWSLDTNATSLPRIVSGPVSQKVLVGGTASFAVSATSTETLNYQWIFNDYLALDRATNATLTLTNIQASAAGRYLVEVSNQTGQRVRSDAANLEVGTADKDQSEDKFRDLFDHVGTSPLQKSQKIKPAFPSVSAGTLGTQNLNNFDATTEQGEPLHGGVIGGSSRWFILRAVERATMVIDTLGSDIDTVLGVYTGTNLFSLREIASDNNRAPDGVRSLVRFQTVAGTDYLVAVDGVNGAQGNVVLNWRMGEPPLIMSAPTNQTVNANDTASFSAAASGTPSPGYQWQFNGRDVPGATNPVLVLSNVQPVQAGSYRVVASNFIDKAVSAAANLSVAPQPLLVKPGSLVITNGAFRMVIEGAGTQSVVIEATTDLGNSFGWLAVWTNNPASGTSEFVDPSAGQGRLRFYRARFAPY